MENFQEFIESFRPQHFAVGAPLNLLINTALMWYVANKMTDTAEKASLLRCGVCALLLYAISSAAIAMLMFPAPIVLILAFLFWLVASMATIQGIFELTYQGGGGILFLYILVLLTAHGVVRMAMG